MVALTQKLLRRYLTFILGNASIDVPIRSLESMVLLENAAEENGIELHRHNFLEHSLPESTLRHYFV